MENNDLKEIQQKYIKRKRTDLSTFLVHLTRDYNGIKAYKNLDNILTNRKIEARNAYGLFQYDTNAKKVVCFTEAPLDQIKTFIEEKIPGRKIELSSYGLVFTQRAVIEKGGNPTFYINTCKDTTYKDAIKSISRRLTNDADFLKLKPFFNEFGKKIDFYWEREWRVPGDFTFDYKDVVVGLCPEEAIERYEGNFNKVKFIDPCWALEEIIIKLVG